MQGFPKHIATKEDVHNLLQSHRTETLSFLQRLLDERFQWVLLSKHRIDEALVPADNQKIVEYEEQDGTKANHLFQWNKVESDGLNRLNLSVTEVVAFGCEDRTIEPGDKNNA